MMMMMNYAATTKLSNPVSIVRTSAEVSRVGTLRTCRSIRGPKIGRSDMSWSGHGL